MYNSADDNNAFNNVLIYNIFKLYYIMCSHISDELKVNNILKLIPTINLDDHLQSKFVSSQCCLTNIKVQGNSAVPNRRTCCANEVKWAVP